MPIEKGHRFWIACRSKLSKSIHMQTKLCILYTFPWVGTSFKNIFVDFSVQSFRKYFVLDILHCEKCWDTRMNEADILNGDS